MKLSAGQWLGGNAAGLDAVVVRSPDGERLPDVSESHPGDRATSPKTNKTDGVGFKGFRKDTSHLSRTASSGRRCVM